MLRLLTTYYAEKNIDRLQELKQAIKKNINNSSIDELVIMHEGGDISDFHSQKITQHKIPNRPSYLQFFKYINNITSANDINIIANTDIYFDATITALEDYSFTGKCLALSRWDIDENGKPVLFNRHDSQDAWIFKGKVKENVYADFPLGVPRCDNRILYELSKAGYEILNPAFSIKSFHLHSGERVDYSTDDLDHFVPGPYKYLYPSNLYNLPKTVWYNVTHIPGVAPYRYDVKKVNRWIPVRTFRKATKLLFNKDFPLIGYQ